MTDYEGAPRTAPHPHETIEHDAQVWPMRAPARRSCRRGRPPAAYVPGGPTVVELQHPSWERSAPGRSPGTHPIGWTEMSVSRHGSSLPSTAVPLTRITALLRAQRRSSGTLSDAQQVLSAARLPASEPATFAMLRRAEEAGELTLAADGHFGLLRAPQGTVATEQSSEAGVGADSPTGATPAATDGALDSSTTGATVRIVAFDVEAAVRAKVEDGGALTRRIWQLGAVRLGTDTAWVQAAARFDQMMLLPDGYSVPEHQAEQHAERARPAEDVLATFATWASGADLLVAYNGESLDFPALAEAFAGAELTPLTAAPVDALFLAYCLWPAARTHQLARLADDLALPRRGRWHDAADDAALLGQLLTFGAQQLATADSDLLDLLRALGRDSSAWRLLAALHPGLPGAGRHLRAAEISSLLDDLLAGQDPRRGHTPAPLAVPPNLREHGQVTPAALARALHGPQTEARPAQQQVTDAIAAAAITGVPAMIEAPTGTGKSLSALAAALSWLDASADHTAIISTHTKQLQSQLANELAELASGVPGLLDTTDVVKGSSNRLSLRGLVYTLADASGADVGTAASLIRYTDSVRFRELLTFLMLRLVHPNRTKTYRWSARSVDHADLPAFFSGYCGPALPAWLTSLSQATHGEWRDPARIPVAVHTDEVGEALDTHRLVIANHALLLSHWEELSARADTTLLIADEAHALEGAATDALSSELSAEDVDDALGALRQVLADLRHTGATGKAQATLTDLTRWWRDGRMRRTLSRIMDARVGQAQVGGRTLTIASPHTGAHAARDARTLNRILHEFVGQIGRLLHDLGDLVDATAGVLDAFDEQRLTGAVLRIASLRGQAQALEDILDGLLPAPPPAPPATTDDAAGMSPGVGSSDDEPAGSVVQPDLPDEPSPESDQGPAADPETTAATGDGAAPTDGEDDGGDGADDGSDAGNAAPDATPQAPAVPDRVVYAHENGQLDRRGLAHYRVSITASPIELPNDPTWQALLTSFRRMALLSATLTVATPGADQWAYTRSRLGMDDATPIRLDGPFDYRSQARLFALSDFPSWAEQPRQAMRTVAHQLSGYTREITRQHLEDVHPDDEEQPDTPWMHGAMVLTTSRNAAGGIADELALLHADDGRSVPVHNQVVLGTARAVAEFTGPASYQGGVLVGTRGLWTGVDVSEPGRNHLVWINKLPFPVFTDPVIAARRESLRRRAELAGADDPDLEASATYYLPLAALDLRQAVGRLIRNHASRGVVIISDRKLAGDLPLRRLYRQIFLGSLDNGLLLDDPDTGERSGGNVVTMRQAWAQIWPFLNEIGLLPDARLAPLTASAALEEHTLLPATLAIRRLEMTEHEVAQHRAAGTLEKEVLVRCEQVATLLAGEPRTLKPEQRTAIPAVAAGRDSLALLPTGYGKSFCYQLPALVLPGVTVVVSPLINLMHDQALGLNHTIGGAVRALVASLPESVSRAGRTEVVEALGGDTSHGIKIVYVSPERLSQARFRQALARGAETRALRRVAIDEAHTYVQWGEDFRPSFRRAGALLRGLRRNHPGVLTLQALTATATPTVEASLRDEVLAGLVPGTSTTAITNPDALVVVRANPLRPELTLGRRAVNAGTRRSMAALAEQIVDAESGHTVLYCLTVRDTDWLHAHLRDYLDGRPVLLRKFHGRLPEVEKASVSLEFKEASSPGEADHARMIVVATSAFGLGVDRKDVRSVFCATPPTDLAALYQQLGRGGRDVAGDDVSSLQVTTNALAFATNRSLGTAAWMAQLDLAPSLLQRFGRAVVRAAARGYLDTSATVQAMLNHDVAQGLLTPQQAAAPRLRSEWTVGLTRAVATLADLDAISDGGDVPAIVALGAGTRSPDTALAVAVTAAVDALPVRGNSPSRAYAPLRTLHRHLLADPACAAAGIATAAPGLAELWLLLCDLHDAATLDVSQRPNDRMLVAISLTGSVPAQPNGPAASSSSGSTTGDDDGTAALGADDPTTGPALPAQFAARAQGKLARARTEAMYLQQFFAATRTCLNARLADYFNVPVPAQCCSTDRTKCSVCAAAQDGPGTQVDTPLHALVHGTLTPQGVDAGVRAARLDASVEGLLAATFNGLTPNRILSVLTGKDREWIMRLSAYRPLPQRLRDTAQFGEHPDVSAREVTASIDRLRDAERVVDDGRYARTTANAARGPRRVRQYATHTATGAATTATVAPTAAGQS